MPKSAPPASPFDVQGPRLFSIDHGRPFLDDLAEELIEALGADLPSAEIYFPTRRAVRAAADAFLSAYEERGVGAALLPRFKAIGDIEEEELIAFTGDAQDELNFPPAVSSTERMIMLARIISAQNRIFAGQGNWPAAIAAARELGRLLDAFYTDEIDPSRLREIDVEDAAEHWARSLDFLEIVISIWPDYLRRIGRIDTADRRARLISATAERIAAAAPQRPLIIAGTTASAPAVARLVDAISRAPKGLAVLPGLDRSMDKRSWDAIDDAHPQSGLKALLGQLKLEPEAVRPWRGSGGENPRRALLTLALRPAAATDDWLSLVGVMTREDPALVQATRGVSLIEAENEESEASIIAAILRIAVEEPGKTAILVTPDRHLSRRVALKMRRWRISVDDSAGVPFSNTPRGTFLRLVGRFLENPSDPVLFLALLRHPLASFGLDPDARIRAVDAIDHALRGERLAKGLQHFREAFAKRAPQLSDALAVIDRSCAAATVFQSKPDAAFIVLLDAHIDAAERIAGGEILWSGDDGEAGAALLAELRDAAALVEEFADRRYMDVFEAMIAAVAVRNKGAAHPRISILGPLEARMQSADLIILGGMNEGEWPADAARDPFLSRKMRKDLGLPSPERRLGLSAHDFASLAAHREIVLTRSKRADGKPANPSRWIVRLKNILIGAGALDAVDRSEMWRATIEKLHEPERVKPQGRPNPKAGPGRRPREVSVTRVGKWLRDPYAIYATYLLGLRKVEDPGGAFTSREMGMLMHKVFEMAAQAGASPTAASLQAIFDEQAAGFGLSDADRRFWSAAVRDSFAWFVDFEASRRAEGRAGVLEGEGRWTVPGIDPPFTLTARADRIDILNDGRAAIFDYKLGAIPTENQIRRFTPQLPLTGALVEAGGFQSIGAREVASYAYCRLFNRKDRESDNTLSRSGADTKAAIEEAIEGLKSFVRRYDDPEMTYHSQPRPEFVDDYGDFDQLARRREWGATDDGADGGGE